MAKRLILHIGTHKTGSTAIQNFLFKNRETLLKQGVLYPNAGLHETGHHQLAWALAKKDKKRFLSIMSNIEIEATNSGVENILLSSEEFEFLRDMSLLKSINNRKIEVVVFFRRQDDYLESEYNQHVKMFKNRFPGDIFHFYLWHDFNNRFNYNFIANQWTTVFGESCFNIIPYDSLSKIDDIFSLFLKTIHVNPDENLIFPSKNASNISLPPKALIYLSRLNRRNMTEPQHQKAIQILTSNPSLTGKSIFLDFDYRKRLLNRYRQPNINVARRFLRSQKLFSETFVSYSNSTLIDYCEDFDKNYLEHLLEELNITDH